MSYTKRNWSDKTLPINPRIVVWGATGSGKSVFSNRLMVQYSKNFKCVIMDTKNEYQRYNTLSIQDFKERSFIRRVRELEIETRTISNPTEVCEIIAGLLNEFERTILYIEEVPLIVPPLIKIYQTLPNLGTLILQGRRFYNGYIAVAQRPAELHNDFVSQCFDTYVFHVRPNYIELLCKKIGFIVPFEEMEEFEFFSTSDQCIYKPVKPVKEKRGTSKKGITSIPKHNP